ncbi:MAG: hypothetical protein JW951_08000 [Lentisphaerae bacterium]|nr:hypothetical protein [Lentisphaerota bacterium]
MKAHIEFCGIPGSGKSRVIAAWRRAQGGAPAGVLGRREAMLRCLRRRNDGRLKNAMKRLPPCVWERFMGTDYAAGALRRFLAGHTGLAALVTAAVAERDLSARDADIVLGACFCTFTEYALAAAYLRDTELLAADEGFAHRAFTLFGYVDEPVPDAAIRRYAELIPAPDALVWVRTPPDLCEARMAARPAEPFRYPIQLAALNPAARTARLARGAACLEVAVAVLEARGVDVRRVDNSGAPEDAVRAAGGPPVRRRSAS